MPSLNIFLRVFTFLFSLFFTLSVHATQKNIAIIVPLEHEAMKQIVSGIVKNPLAV